jgi:hypothetical protein
MADLKVTAIDISPEFAQFIGVHGFQAVFPHTLAALNVIATKYQIQWRQFTMGADIPGTSRKINSRGDYTKSINVDTTDVQTKIVSSRGPWTDWIEAGHGELDLKPGLLRGPKARLGRNGPYNIVHFRQGIPNTLASNHPMPINIYQIIKKETDKADRAGGRGTSRVTGTTTVDGRQVRTYDWGYRVPKNRGGQPQTKLTSLGEYTWKTGKFSGMVRMDTSTARAKSSSYMTFRTVSTKSDPASWIVPPLEGVPIRQAVIDSLRDDVKAFIKMAIEEDLK